MKRAVLALLVALFLVALGWPIVRGAERGAGAEAGGLCTLMTPSGILEHPALAHELAEVLRSGDAIEVGRVEDLLREIRSVHGCDGETPVRARPALPPGHPPIHDRFMDDGRPSRDLPAEEAPFLEGPGIVTI